MSSLDTLIHHRPDAIAVGSRFESDRRFGVCTLASHERLQFGFDDCDLLPESLQLIEIVFLLLSSRKLLAKPLQTAV